MSVFAPSLAKVNPVAAATAVTHDDCKSDGSEAVVNLLDRELLKPWFDSADAAAASTASSYGGGRSNDYGDNDDSGSAMKCLSTSVLPLSLEFSGTAIYESADGLGGRRVDPVWPPPSMPRALQHVRQSRSWDCGLACVQMVANFCAPSTAMTTLRSTVATAPDPQVATIRTAEPSGKPASAISQLANTFETLRDEVGTTSVWTVHLSTLLRARGVAHIYTTTCAGINEDLKSMHFYRDHIDKDEARVLALFDEARAAGVPIIERSFPVSAWLHAIMTRRIVLILLVDTRALRCEVCGCFKRQFLTCSFTGHYIVVFAYDTARECFAYHDPGSACMVCWMRPIDFDKARSAKGTDEDVIICAY